MMNLNERYPIGIDIGNRNVYAAQLKKTGQGFTVRALFHRELDRDNDGSPEAGDTLVSVLKEIRKDRRFSGKSAVVNLPIQNILSFPIRFQVGSAETIDEAILRESIKHLPFPVEEAVIDYPSLTSVSASDADDYKAIIIAVRRNIIEQYLRLLRQAVLVVEAIDFCVSSLIHLHTHLHDATPNLTILCNIGYSQSLISIVTKDSILAHLTIQWGIQPILNKIKGSLNLGTGTDKAKALLKMYGLHYEDREGTESALDRIYDWSNMNMYRAIYQIITPSIDELIYEFQKIIGYVRSEQQNPVFEDIYLYGHAALISFMDHYLEKRLYIRTRFANPMAKVAPSGDLILPDIAEGAPFALALGLAMRKVKWF